jgi:SAM-dependent methyltransferase
MGDNAFMAGEHEHDGSDYGPDGKYRTDYLGVHQPGYEAIAAGQRAGWSTAADSDAALAHVRRALELPGAPQQGRLLELGCGDGCLTVPLAQLPGFSVSGVDLVPLAVELAARRAQAAGVALDLRVGNVLDLPWPEASFDVVVDGHCLHCIVLGDRRRVFAEAWRVLRPGGMLVLITMVGDPAAGMPGCFDPALRCLVRDGVAGRHFGTPEGILGEVKQAGFAVLAHWLWPAQAADENDDLIAAALKPA